MPLPAPLLRACALASMAGVLAACGPPAAQPPNWGMSPQALRGQLLVAQYQCGSCHVIPEVVGARGSVGPALGGFGRRSYIAGHVPNHPETLARWIMDPTALAPGTAMPSMGVPLQDARAMAAFLNALR